MDYTFNTLNDKDFEILSCDLLSKLFEKHVERFKQGRDGGVDGRFFSDSKEEVIIQCKHYFKSGFRKLLSDLTKKELPKITALNPKRYIVVTSISLSRKNKAHIENVLSPYIKCQNDIFGREDLNKLLQDYPKILLDHYKIWMSSTTVLQEVLHNAVSGRSKYKIEEIQQNADKYVVTENHKKAMDHLKKNKVLIITGEPGVGKTTLAEQICIHYASQGYSFVSIEDGIRDAEDLYQKDQKQIFLYDDFLGSVYFEAVSNKKDSHVMSFIDRIRNDKKKIFILTSRTNILNSGIVYSDFFHHKNVKKNEYVLRLSLLQDIDKARILYNHLWFGSLRNSLKNVFYKDKKYWKVIKHANFNPRLIEFITDSDRYTSTVKDYWAYVLSKLDNPNEVWEKCFNVQSNDYVRTIVYFTVLNGGTISEDYLRQCYQKWLSQGNKSSNINYDFQTVVKIAANTFINRNIRYQMPEITVFNPSVSDYVVNALKQNRFDFMVYFKILRTVRSLGSLESMFNNRIIDYQRKEVIFLDLLLDSIAQQKNVNYSLICAYHCCTNKAAEDSIIKILDQCINEPEEVDEIENFLFLVSEFYNKLDVDDYDFIVDVTGVLLQEKIDIIQLNLLTEVLNIQDHFINSVVRDSVMEYLESEIKMGADSISLDQYVTVEYVPDSVWDDPDDLVAEATYNDYEIVDAIATEIDEEVLEVAKKCNFLEGSIERLILATVDIESLADDYANSLSPAGENETNYTYKNLVNDVDLLFEKS